MQQYLDIGKIVNTHGVKGEVKVIPLTDDPERFHKLKWVYVDKKTGPEKFEIDSVKFFKAFVILKFREVNDMETAESLKDYFLKVDRQNAVKLPKDSYFICDLIDSRVETVDGKSLGMLAEILQTGSNDVYVVKNENRKEILIPALKSVVRSISVEDRRIVVELPEGLVEDEI